MQNRILNVEGMSCSHCETAVKNALGELAGVKDVLVSLKDKTVEVVFEEGSVDIQTIKNEIEEQGYNVID